MARILRRKQNPSDQDRQPPFYAVQLDVRKGYNSRAQLVVALGASVVMAIACGVVLATGQIAVSAASVTAAIILCRTVRALHGGRTYSGLTGA
jgi:hypothetical protein